VGLAHVVAQVLEEDAVDVALVAASKNFTDFNFLPLKSKIWQKFKKVGKVGWVHFRLVPARF
jgi:hypothetical protein